MATLAAPIVNWGGSPAPHSGAELVPITSIVPGNPLLMPLALSAPAANQLSPGTAAGAVGFPS
jgi:hypothetical protein